MSEKSAVELMQEGLDKVESEVLQETNSEQDETTEVEKAPNPYEDRARKMGWRPKSELDEDFDETKFIEAGEFIRRQELFDKIGHEVKARQKLEAELKNVTSYVKKLTESEFNRQLAQLKAERQLALEEQDTATADSVNEKIVELKTAQTKQEEAAEQEQQESIKAHNQQVLGTWAQANPWFNTDPELRTKADDFAEQFAKKYPSETLEDLLEYVDTKMYKFVKQSTSKQDNDEEEQEAEEKVVPMSKVATSKTTTSRAAAKAKAKVGRSNLNATQKHILDTWILPNKVMSEDEYISSLVAIGEVTVD